MSAAEVATQGLFPTLLGERFASLHPRVQQLHCGTSMTLQGTATIERGSGVLARLMCAAAMLPRDQQDGPLTVNIDVAGGAERWTRHFGISAPMRSTLQARDGLLREQLGLVTFWFALHARDGGIDWRLTRVAVAGCPLPCALFRISTFSGVRDGRYAFSVLATVTGVGRLIRYEGVLSVAR